MTHREIQKKLDKESKEVFKRLKIRNPGTEKAGFDCELCGGITHFVAFTSFVYPRS